LKKKKRHGFTGRRVNTATNFHDKKGAYQDMDYMSHAML